MRRSCLVVVGDSLLDRDLEGRVDRLSPDAPVPVVEDVSSRSRPGGAGLAASLAAAAGHDVRLITALGRDAAGEELRDLVQTAGVEVIDLGLFGPTPEKVRVRSQGRTLLRLDFGGRSAAHPGRERPDSGIGPATAQALSELRAGSAVLVSDYGQGITSHSSVRAFLTAVARQVPVVWDPHPRGDLPIPGARLVKPNRHEAGVGPDLAEAARRAAELRRQWLADGVVITLGEQGALLVGTDDVPFVAPAPRLTLHDACGAGDSFCAAAAGLLGEGADLQEAVSGAVHAASAFVAAGGAVAFSARRKPAPAAVEGTQHALRLVAEVRARGGRVVATGGCFDLLHAGHVSTLRGARSLGDCLVVCLNSDASVRRLKGPGRPLVPEADRATVLEALDCVDAVVLFDEPTPEAVLRRLQPDVFAKGGDYAGKDLRERAVVAEWGGEVVLLPHLQGRSSTRLMEEATRIGHS